jgi:hypothetical protein
VRLVGLWKCFSTGTGTDCKILGKSGFAAKRVCLLVEMTVEANVKNTVDKCKEQENNYNKIEIKQVIYFVYFGVVIKLLFMCCLIHLQSLKYNGLSVKNICCGFKENANTYFSV